ncbi:MAG: FAD-binding protein, partial [Anaerolineales bacterium]
LTDDWRLTIGPGEVVALPAVLGLARHLEVHHAVETALRMHVIEIPTLPPSVPGLRLERALRRAGEQAGVRFVEGSRAVGRVAGRGRQRLADGVAALTRGGMRIHPADAVILASGGPLHGGWEAGSDGTARESVFGLPVATGPASEWTTTRLTDPQPYTRFGLKVDRRLRPLAQDGRPAFKNVFAVGGILAGADRTREGSRQGIDLSTAFRAVRSALE